MRHLTIISVIILLFTGCNNNTSKQNAEKGTEQNIISSENYEQEISIMFGGDLMFHMPQISAAYSCENGYDFSKCFQYIQDNWKGCDAVIFNLETTLSDSDYSGYPQFAAPKEVAHNLKDCGVTHLVLANNHTCDKHAKGIRKTINYLSEVGIETAGCYLDSNEWAQNTPLFIKKDSFNIALLNYTYGTNGLPVPKGMVVPQLDTIQIANDIEKAKSLSATNIITFLHWGNEYQNSPCDEQIELAQWLHNNGVDIVIGSHPHVIQRTETLTDGITVYSLGNFISNQRNRHTNGGLLVKLNLTHNTKTGESNWNITHFPHFVYKAPLGDSPRYYCVPENLIDSVIKEAPQRKEAEIFFTDTKNILECNK
ncbi:MAG: CapA family protein [Rikenellaceae bacterium]